MNIVFRQNLKHFIREARKGTTSWGTPVRTNFKFCSSKNGRLFPPFSPYLNVWSFNESAVAFNEYCVFGLQTILSSKPEGDCKVNNLRRQGQSLCDHQDADEGRRVHVQQTVRDTEEQWRTVLQAAKQVEAAAGAEITEETERRKLEVRDYPDWLTLSAIIV